MSILFLLFIVKFFAAQAANANVVKFQNLNGDPIQSLFFNLNVVE